MNNLGDDLIAYIEICYFLVFKFPFLPADDELILDLLAVVEQGLECLCCANKFLKSLLLAVETTGLKLDSIRD